MGLFGKKPAEPIRVTLNVRAFIEGRMVRLRLDAAPSNGAKLSDLLKQLGREGAIEASVVRYILKGSRGVTVLQNGRHLPAREAASTPLADGDELSVLTPLAGG